MAAHSNDTLNRPWLPFRDYYPAIKASFKQLWLHQWSNTEGNKLRYIKNSVSPWQSSINTNRKISVTLIRLRIGHTQLTHGHLMSQSPRPTCSFCLDAPVSVRHIFIDCPALNNHRIRCFPLLLQNNETDPLSVILGEHPPLPFDPSPILQYLRSLNLPYSI